MIHGRDYNEYKRAIEKRYADYRSLNSCYNDIKEFIDNKRDRKDPITCDEFLDFYQLESISTWYFGV